MNIKPDKDGDLWAQSFFWLLKSMELQAAAVRNPSGAEQRLANRALDLALDLELAHWARVKAGEGGPA